MNASVSSGDSIRTIKLRNHHLTISIWPEGGRILEVQSLANGRHMLSWWPYKTSDPGRAGGIGESGVCEGAGAWTVKELPDRVLLSRDLGDGVVLKKSIHLPADSLIFHVSLLMANEGPVHVRRVLEESAAICPGFGGATPRPESGILNCRHKAFLKRDEELIEEICYEIFEGIRVERDDLEWVLFNDPVGDSSVTAMLPDGHTVIRSEYHWWLEWSRAVSLAPGAKYTADFHYAVTGNVDEPIVAGEHFIAGVCGQRVVLDRDTRPKVAIFGLDAPAAGNAVTVAENGKTLVSGKPMPDGRELFEVPLGTWQSARDMRVEVSLGGKYGAADFLAADCARLYEELDKVCRRAHAAADAGSMSRTKAAGILAMKRIVDAGCDKSTGGISKALAAAVKAALWMESSKLEARPFYSEAERHWQLHAARRIDLKGETARLCSLLNAQYDLEIPRFREPDSQSGAFALADRLLEAALVLSVQKDNDLAHLFVSRLRDVCALWARFGAIFYETIHHGVLLTRLIPACQIASQHGWLSLSDEIDIHAMILDLCAKIYRRGGKQFRLSNWWAMESAALAYAAACLPYIPEADDYISGARETFYWLLVHGTLGDGGFWEMSPSYHVVTLEYLLHIAEALLRGGENLYAHDTCGRALSEMGDFLKVTAASPGRLPAFDDGRRDMRAAALLMLGKRCGDGEIIYHADAALSRRGRGRGATELFTPVDAPAAARPEAKNAVLKPSGKLLMHDPGGELSLVLDFGPHGGWHGHNDKLSFELFWKDACLVPDAGCYRYEEALHWSWFKTAMAHNTITLGERNQRDTAGRFLYLLEGETFVTAGVIAETYKGVTHWREMTFGEDVLLIDDFVEGAQPGESIVWRMNSFVPIEVGGGQARFTRDRMTVTISTLGQGLHMEVEEVPLMGEEESAMGAYVMGWQLRICKTAAKECEQILTRLDLQREA